MNQPVYSRMWTYIGEFLDDRINGQGILQFPNGNLYEGDFIDGRMEGNGKLTWANGSSYSGMFLNNLPDGQGRFVDVTGQFWQGLFSRGRVKNSTRKGEEWLDCLNHVRKTDIAAITTNSQSYLKRPIKELSPKLSSFFYNLAPANPRGNGLSKRALGSSASVGITPKRSVSSIWAVDWNNLSDASEFSELLCALSTEQNRIPVVLFDASIPSHYSPSTCIAGDEACKGPSSQNVYSGVVHMRYLNLMRRRLQDWRSLIRENAKHAVLKDKPLVLVIDSPIEYKCIESKNQETAAESNFSNLESCPQFPEDWSYENLFGVWFPSDVFDPQQLHGSGIINRFIPDASGCDSNFQKTISDIEDSISGDQLPKEEKPIENLWRLRVIIAVEMRLPSFSHRTDDVNSLASLVENCLETVIPLHRCSVIVVTDMTAKHESADDNIDEDDSAATTIRQKIGAFDI